MVGTKFLSLVNTPILWFAFLLVIFMYSLKLSLLSIVTPNNLILFRDSMSVPYTFTRISSLLSLCLLLINMVWYLERLPLSKFDSYHKEAIVALAFRLSLIVTTLSLISKSCWSSAFA